MLTIKVEGMEELKRKMSDLQKRQLPFATAQALTLTAKDVEAAEYREMRDVFDRPTKTTLTSLYVRPATRARLVAEVGIKDFAGKGNAASKFLAAQVKGGTRRAKRFEVALQRVGAMPDAGYRVVPGEGANLDGNGNISPGQIVQILSWFKAFPETGYKANMTDKRRAALGRGNRRTGALGFAYFVGRPGDRLPLGIWKRISLGHGSAIKPVMLFVPHANYQALLDFHFVAQATVEKNFNRHFAATFRAAIETAR
jgi:hypothetical protein